MCVLHLHTTAFYSYSTLFFFFNDTATTEIYTLSLHDALPIYTHTNNAASKTALVNITAFSPTPGSTAQTNRLRSEEHTSELQSLRHLVCRLLLEKKKKNKMSIL